MVPEADGHTARTAVHAMPSVESGWPGYGVFAASVQKPKPKEKAPWRLVSTPFSENLCELPLPLLTARPIGRHVRIALALETSWTDSNRHPSAHQ